jgi:hypothetical protein
VRFQEVPTVPGRRMGGIGDVNKLLPRGAELRRINGARCIS